MIVDSHCHLDYAKIYVQLDDIINRAIKNYVKVLLTICTTLESFQKIKLIIVVLPEPDGPTNKILSLFLIFKL